MLPPEIACKINDIPSEKTTETLFISRAFHYLKTTYRHLNISIFAPSQTDENSLGYDARFVGANCCFEVLLQFKKAKLRSDVFIITTQQTQHERLQSYAFEDRLAFYVAPTFKTYGAVGAKEEYRSEEFLDNYVAVNASALYPNKPLIKYENGDRGYPIKVRQTANPKLSSQLDYDGYHWLKGSELFKDFLPNIVTKPPSGPLEFPNIPPGLAIGSLVCFNDKSNRGVRIYSPDVLAQIDYVSLINDTNNQYGRLFNPNLSTDERPNRKMLNLGTSGIYVFRVYNPFLV